MTARITSWVRWWPCMGGLFLLAPSCDSPKDNTAPTAIVIRDIPIPGFASGSGMAMLGHTYWAVGDDDPYLLQLDAEGAEVSRSTLWDPKAIVNGRIPKPVKPDFEAVAVLPQEGDTVLVIFGSGSKPPQRDVLIVATPGEDGTAHPFSEKFYRWFRAAAQLDAQGLNLEGAALWEEKLILLNRNNNTMYRIPLAGFQDFLTTGDTDALRAEAQTYDLPDIEGHRATFSGAASLKDTQLLLFSASVEVTDNSIDDGKILGSFVGMLDLSSGPDSAVPCARLVYADGSPFTGKLEALEGRQQENGKLRVVGITDNDDGTTQWIEIETDGP